MDTDRVKGAARSAVGSVEEAAGRFSDDARTQLSGVSDRAVGAAQNAYGKVKDAARSAADQTPGLQDAVDVGQDYYRRGAEQVGRQVSEQPIQSLLIAGAIGFFLGWLFGRD